MNKTLVIILLALAGCTTNMPDDGYCPGRHGVEPDKIRTRGNMNGYLVGPDDIVEGRTENANYNRLLVDYGAGVAMTKYAYDIGKKKDQRLCCIYIWDWAAHRDLYDALIRLAYDSNNYRDYAIWDKIFYSRSEYRNIEVYMLTCHEIYVKSTCFTFLSKEQANKYLQNNPNTRILEV